MSRFLKASTSRSSLSFGLVVTGMALAALVGCGSGSGSYYGDASQSEAAAGSDSEGVDLPSDDSNDAGSGGKGSKGGTSGNGGNGSGDADPETGATIGDSDPDDNDPDDNDPGDVDNNAGGAGGAGGAPDAGGAAGAGGDSTAPTDPDALRFADVSCVHEQLGLKSVTEGQNIECGFQVLGKSGKAATLSCQDLQGKPVDCNPNGAQPLQIWPDGAQPLPLTFAGFWGGTNGLGGSTVSIVLVASDGTETARHRLDIPIAVDNGVPDAPTLKVDCGQAKGSTTVEIEAGKNLDCIGSVVDLDPDMLEYSIDLVSAEAPTWLPIPAAGGLWGTGYFGWTFFAQAADVGKSFDYTFKVNDYVHTPVTTTFTIVVK